MTAHELLVMDVVRDRVHVLGCRRVVLLGDSPASDVARIRSILVGAGLVVLTPGEQDRAWLAQLCREAEGREGLPREAVERFARMLDDGVEHGVDAIVLANAELRPLLASVEVGVPVIELPGADAKGEPSGR